MELLPSEHIHDIETSMNKFQKIISLNSKVSQTVDSKPGIKYADKIKKVVEKIRKVDWGLNLQKKERMNVRLQTQIQRGKSRTNGVSISSSYSKMNQLKLSRVSKEWKGWRNHRKRPTVKVINSERNKQSNFDYENATNKNFTPNYKAVKKFGRISEVRSEPLEKNVFFKDPVLASMSPIGARKSSSKNK